MRHKLVAALTLSLMAAGCIQHGRPTIERSAPPAPPHPLPASGAIDPEVVVSPGIVEPWGAQVDLSAQESGWIVQILVREGEIVRNGQLLAMLDDTAQRHDIELAQAELAEAEALLARIERGATLEELRQAQADYDAAAARDEFARTAAERMKKLHDKGVVSDNELDRATAEARAQSALASREAERLIELKRGARAEDRQAAAARLQAARARLQVAQAGLDRRRVVAATAGTVLLSRFHAGEFYNAGAGPLFALGDMTRLQIRLEVDEIDAAAPALGADCAIYSDGGIRLAEGIVVRLAPKMGRRALPLESPTARTDVRVREVFVEVPSTSGLIPNQRVWGHLLRTTRFASELKGAR